MTTQNKQTTAGGMPIAPLRDAVEPTPGQLVQWAYRLFFAALATGAAIVLAAVLGVHPGSPTGGFLGGALYPLLGLLVVFLLLISILVQRHELKERSQAIQTTNERAALQAFEQSLFSWLASYRSLLSDVRIENGRKEKLEGRRALKDLYGRYFEGFLGAIGQYGQDLDPALKRNYRLHLLNLAQAQPSSPDHYELGMIFMSARKGYMHMFDEHQLELDAVFRTLFSLFKWIDESPLTREQRWHYAALVRAQLSWIELACMLYHACSDEGAQFALYINRYALLDNLAAGPDKLIELVRETDLVQTSPALSAGHTPFVFPLTPAAFSSEAARSIWLGSPD